MQSLIRRYTKIYIFLIVNTVMGIVAFSVISQGWAEESEAMQVGGFLPKQVDGWSAVGEDKLYTRSTIFEYMDGAGEIYLAYDFQHLLVREYAKESAGSIVAEIYQMGSSEDAYGIFTHDTGGERVELGQGAVYALGLLRFWKDHIFARLFAERETDETKSVIFAIASKVVDAVPEGKMPELIACLPADGLIENSILYFHKQVSLNSHYYLADSNILNLSENTSAVLARYRIGEQKLLCLIVRYQKPKSARTAYIQFNSAYFRDKPAVKSFARSEEVEDGKFVSARCVDRFVILVFESNDRDTSESCAESAVRKLREVFPWRKKIGR